jgi:DNA-directed RNA polymerase alpha subunit
MHPVIENVSKGETTTFTLSGVNVSIANAVRRTLLSDIPTVVFQTTPHEANKCTIYVNTSRLNNEIVKQRLSCIPIHIPNVVDIPLNKYLLEVNVENTTDTILFVTTEDFKIKNVETNTYLSQTDTRNIFPPNDTTGYFIDFIRLRPKLSDELVGEKIHLTCEFSTSTAKEDGMYNVVSTCSYGFTPDLVKMEQELQKKIQGWKNEGKTKEDIEFESKNWKLLDGLRIVINDSFDFIIQSVGVYTNAELLQKACEILIHRLEETENLLETDEIVIQPSQNTMENAFDIVLENEDYTLGKIIEFLLFHTFFEGTKILSFCGFKKYHPHDTESIVRLAYKEMVDTTTVKGHLKEVLVKAKEIYTKMKREFLKAMK